MSRYFNPVDDVPKVGRHLIGYPGCSYETVRRQVQAGEVLVGLYDKFIFRAAPFIRTAETFDHFEQSYEDGIWLGRDFYAIPQAVAEAHDRPLEMSEMRG